MNQEVEEQIYAILTYLKLSDSFSRDTFDHDGSFNFWVNNIEEVQILIMKKRLYILTFEGETTTQYICITDPEIMILALKEVMSWITSEKVNQNYESFLESTGNH